MFKAITISAALFAAPAMAQSIEPERALIGMIRMQAAKQYCGIPIDPDVAAELMAVVLPHLKKSTDELVEAILSEGSNLGAQYVNNGTIGVFCAEIGRIYGRAGK